MPITTLLHILTFTLLLTLTISISDPPAYSPAPSPPPQSGSDNSISSPPVPPPSIQLPDRSLPPFSFHASSPSPAEISDDFGELESEEPKEESGGMSGGKKAGVAFGMIAAACFVGFGGVLYRKRQQNIRRARYSQSARLEFF